MTEEMLHVEPVDPFDRFDYFGRELSVDAEPGLVTDPGVAAEPACRVTLDGSGREAVEKACAVFYDKWGDAERDRVREALEAADASAIHLLGPESAIDLAAWLVRWALPHLDKEAPPGLSAGPYMRAFNARDQLDLCQIACRRGDPS